MTALRGVDGPTEFDRACLEVLSSVGLCYKVFASAFLLEQIIRVPSGVPVGRCIGPTSLLFIFLCSMKFNRVCLEVLSGVGLCYEVFASLFS